jgi:site-specific recombinase XerD
MPVSQSDPRLAEYAAYSKTQSNLAIKTAKDYVADVTRFAAFPAPLRAEQATQSHVVQYISHCHDRGLKSGTIGRRLFAIRSFSQFLKRRGLRDDDPTEGVSIPEESHIEERAVLTREEVRRALNVAGDRHVLRYKMMLTRDKAMLSLFYSGLKRNEAVALNLADVNVEAKQCKIAGRMVPMSADTVAALRAYIAERPKSKERALFVAVKGVRITPREAWSIAKKAGLRSGIDKPVSPESLRTAFAVHWIEEGRNPFDLAPILGIETSGIENYAKLARAETDDSEAFKIAGLTDALFDQLDVRRTKSAWHKIIHRAQSDPDGAITQTRTLLESICKHILASAGIEARKTENLSGLCKRALAVVLPLGDDEDDHGTKFARIAAGLVDHLSTYRNTRCDAHASPGERAVEQHQARYAVGLAAATAAFLVHCFAMYRTKQNGKVVAGETDKVLSLSQREREMLALLLQAASRSSASDKRAAYSDLLRRSRSANNRGSTNGETYLHLTVDEVTMIQDLVAPDPDLPRQTANVIKRLSAKLQRLGPI